MIGQLLFYTCLLYALIRSGVIHCFIVKGIVKKLGQEPSVVAQIKIEMSDGDQVHSSLILVKEIVFFRGCAMVKDLIIMDMPDFDMILSIDFLRKYEAEIDCKKKKI